MSHYAATLCRVNTDTTVPLTNEVGGLIFWLLLAAVVAALFLYLRRRRG